MPAEGRENPLLKKGNSDAFFREKYLTKNKRVRENLISQTHLVLPHAGSFIKSATSVCLIC